MTIIKPKKLKKGDTVGILAVSGAISEYENISRAKNFFENEGYRVVVSDTCKSSHLYMAGKNDDDCVSALHDFFKNDEINAIVCARGGYGTLRLVDKINWDIIAENPKIFAGYSDITVLLNMIFAKTGLITFHSPMCNGDFASSVNEYTKKSFFNTLEGKTEEVFAQDIMTYFEGCDSGRLFGGNLTVLASLCGLDFVPDDNIILFLEDLNEAVYKTDRSLTQLFNVKSFAKKVKGIALGEFKNVDDTVRLNTLFEEFSRKVCVPVCNGFKITHDKTKDTIPVGVSAVFDSKIGKISFAENYVV